VSGLRKIRTRFLHVSQLIACELRQDSYWRQWNFPSSHVPYNHTTFLTYRRLQWSVYTTQWNGTLAGFETLTCTHVGFSSKLPFRRASRQCEDASSPKHATWEVRILFLSLLISTPVLQISGAISKNNHNKLATKKGSCNLER